MTAQILASAPLTPAGAWRTWSFDPVVLGALAVTAWLYASGVRKLWRWGRAGRGIRRWQAAAFAGGLVALAVALVSPLDAMAEALLSAHMVQHLLLIVVAPPLLVVGRPLIAAAAVRPGWRRAAHRAARGRLARGAGRGLGHPLAVWFLALGALWTWHLPALYDAAARSEALHALEHQSFLATSLLFWWTALQPTGPRRLARGLDVLFVVTGAFQGALLGALITFASTPLYPAYVESSRAWGVSALSDQQWAGAVMWIPSGFVYLAVASALFVRWLRAMDRETRKDEARPARFARSGPGSLTLSSERSRPS